MALVRIPFIGLIFRPFVEQEISRKCLLGLLKQINPERNFDGELMVFGAMNTRDVQARYDFLIKGAIKAPLQVKKLILHFLCCSIFFRVSSSAHLSQKN